MKMYEDNPSRLVRDKWLTWYFWENSFGRPIIWTEETVNSFTQKKLKDYRTSLYTKDNLIIVVAGKWAEREEIKELIAKYFWWMGEQKTVEQPKFPNTFPNEHESFCKKWTEQNHLIISAKWILGTDERKYAAKVLGGVLWWNMSSRLFQNISQAQRSTW